MYQQATKEVTMLHQQDLQDGGDFPSRLQKDLKTLRVCQLKYQTPPPRPTPTNNATTTNGKSRLFHGKSESSSTPSPTDVVEGQQEEHLDAMSRHLEELGSLATNLNDSMSRQSDTLETLDGKSESMLFKSKMVTRRADRIIQKKVRCLCCIVFAFFRSHSFSYKLLYIPMVVVVDQDKGRVFI
jgi:hypothetical protein